jgi:hypothetical protein
MKTNIIAFVGVSAIVVVLAFGFVIVRPVLAQVAATSTESSTAPASPVDINATSTSTEASSTPSVENTATSTPTAQMTSTNSSTGEANNSGSVAKAMASQKVPIEPPPAGLTEVHIIGTKYTDYFTDGSTTIAVPGDQNIDSNLNKPDAPIPTRASMTWVHTIGQNLYDTPSGDLEVGDYAVQPDGSYVQHAPPFVSSTSTPAQLTTSAITDTVTGTSSITSSVVSPSVPDASTPITPTDTGTDASSSASL